ncbi:GNAT family N-acetyltransferase [Aurantimonas sp. MSK8Z-1]|uniref:GNAT family N-acetyltransferase n=1 Tax=Mangrovibrevibacter kandeliae TaxID=2968473 RepID=UPI002118F3EC|nr:GNAT family N-acetyltransferase [Aurantimonas sp. MSK8Z-1]MCW4114023.1 GNAT family N-acetyltransferase [Aurantimonas sp. MSK8Z-1]
MSALSFREGGEADLPAVLALIAQPDYSGAAMDEAEARGVLARMRSHPYYKLLLVEDGDGVAGMLCLLVIDNLGHMGRPIGLVENVVVASGRQGTGLGKALVAEAGRRAAEAGAYKLILATGLGREGAHAFYERLGFTRYGYSYGLPLTEDAR